MQCLRAVLGAVSVLAGASSAGATEPAAVSFQRDIAPLLKVRCAACHLTGEEAGGMALHPRAAYRTLVGVKSAGSPLLRVQPGAPDASYLLRKLEGTQVEAGGGGMRMPMDGEALSAAEIQTIRAWIAAGAPDN
jgi:cytochrome c553